MLSFANYSCVLNETGEKRVSFLNQTLGEKQRSSPLMEQVMKAGRFVRKAGNGYLTILITDF